MTTTTRADHVAWTRQRALDELDGTPAGRGAALASVASDLGKHPDTAQHGAILLGAMLAMGGHLGHGPAGARAHRRDPVEQASATSATLPAVIERLRHVLGDFRLIGVRAKWAIHRSETPAERWRRERCAHLRRTYGDLID